MDFWAFRSLNTLVSRYLPIYCPFSEANFPKKALFAALLPSAPRMCTFEKPRFGSLISLVSMSDKLGYLNFVFVNDFGTTSLMVNKIRPLETEETTGGR